MSLLNDLPPEIKEGLLRGRYVKRTCPALGAPFRVALEEMPSHRLQRMVEEAMATDASLPIDFELPESNERRALVEALLPLLEGLSELVIQEDVEAHSRRTTARPA